jgi:hypothetical protein
VLDTVWFVLDADRVNMGKHTSILEFSRVEPIYFLVLSAIYLSELGHDSWSLKAVDVIFSPTLALLPLDRLGLSASYAVHLQ